MLRLVLASAIVACTSAFAPSGVPAAGRFFQRPALSARVSPLASVAGGRSQVRAASLGLRCAEDADLSLFSSGSGPAEFCSELTQTEHIELAGNRALKTSADTPAFAIFGSGKMAGIEQMSVKVVKQQGCMFIGACVVPRSPSSPGYADSLRTWAVMAKESGSVYRTGVLGTKLTEYMGKEIKKHQMGDSYPPKYKADDVVWMELNHDEQSFKLSVNGGSPFQLKSVPGARFFVNMEGLDSAVELVAE
ncbi:hypothetical protein T484DRAFT_1881970 [Baffinella frigidus]|nr:hypothetical protein T484DRAFT_1881970 [Cryptophyta sp. CCMP2293]